MKQTAMFFRLLFLSLLPLLPCSALAQTNLLSNPGFEASQNGNPHYWITYPGAREEQTDPRIELIREESPEGKCFLRMSKRGGKTSLALAQAINATDKSGEEILKAGDKMIVFKGKVRGENLTGKNDGLVIQVFGRKADGKGHFVGRLFSKETTPSTEWQTAEIRFRLSDILPPGETLVYLDIMLQVGSNTGQVDFDDLSLTLED